MSWSRAKLAERLQDALDGRLEPEEHQRFLAALQGHPDLRAEHARLKRLQASLRAVGLEQAPEELLERVRSAAGAEKDRRGRGAPGWSWRKLFGGLGMLRAAVLLIAVGLAIFLVAREQPWQAKTPEASDRRSVAEGSADDPGSDKEEKLRAQDSEAQAFTPGPEEGERAPVTKEPGRGVVSRPLPPVGEAGKGGLPGGREESPPGSEDRRRAARPGQGARGREELGRIARARGAGARTEQKERGTAEGLRLLETLDPAEERLARSLREMGRRAARDAVQALEAPGRPRHLYALLVANRNKLPPGTGGSTGLRALQARLEQEPPAEAGKAESGFAAAGREEKDAGTGLLAEELSAPEAPRVVVLALAEGATEEVLARAQQAFGPATDPDGKAGEAAADAGEAPGYRVVEGRLSGPALADLLHDLETRVGAGLRVLSGSVAAAGGSGGRLPVSLLLLDR